MKRYYRDSDGTFKESASEEFLRHSSGNWPKDKVKFVKKVRTPAGNIAYLYEDDLLPGKKYGPKAGDEDNSNGPRSREKKVTGVGYVRKGESVGNHKPVGDGAPPIAGDAVGHEAVPQRGIFDALFTPKESDRSKKKAIKPAHLSAKPGATHNTDTKRRDEGVSDKKTIGNARSREVRYSFEKKSNSTNWHVKEGKVAKGKALNTHKQVGNDALDEFLKKLK